MMVFVKLTVDGFRILDKNFFARCVEQSLVAAKGLHWERKQVLTEDEGLHGYF